jgi:hypothetical protein
MERCTRINSVSNPLGIQCLSVNGLVPFRWLYTQGLTIDANFRMCGKARGNMNDVELGDGWGHWVPWKPYKAYIDMYGYQEEVRFRSYSFCL